VRREHERLDQHERNGRRDEIPDGEFLLLGFMVQGTPPNQPRGLTTMCARRLRAQQDRRSPSQTGRSLP